MATLGRFSTITVTVTVRDGPPKRHDLDRAQAVVVSLGHVLLAAQDLQEPQAEEDDADEQHGEPDKHGDAQRHRGQLDDGPVAAPSCGSAARVALVA